MHMRRLYTPRTAARYAAALLGVALVAALLGTGPVREPSQGLVVTDRARTAGELAPVRAPITGTVVSVRAVDRQYVTAGTVLVALSTARDRSDLATAEVQSSAARARVRTSLTALAAQERTASDQVHAALTTARAMPPRAAHPPTPRALSPLPTTVTVAERQAAAAETRVEQIADAQVAAAQQTLDRDGTLLAQGLIAPKEMAADAQAYDASRAQAAAAAASVRDAEKAAVIPPQGPTPAASNGTQAAHASAALAAAQAALDTTQATQTAAQQRLATDQALLADGAIPARQVDLDTTANDAASARLDAATAAVRAAQAQLALVHAAPRPAPVRRQRPSPRIRSRAKRRRPSPRHRSGPRRWPPRRSRQSTPIGRSKRPKPTSARPSSGRRWTDGSRTIPPLPARRCGAARYSWPCRSKDGPGWRRTWPPLRFRRFA